MPTNILKSLLIFCLFATTSIFSQEEFITGQLLSNENGEPIVFATIRVKDKAIGVISNLDGSFRIPERFKDFGSVLEISSMGYVSKDILLFELSKSKTNIIRLDPALELLDEVVVEGVRYTRKSLAVEKKMSAVQIVDKAIKNIPLNYPVAPFATVGYYRDFQMNNKKYTNLNEALFEVWDQGFGALDHETTKIRIFKYKRNLDFPIDTIAEKPYDYKSRGKTISGAYLENYGGNEFTILRIHDALRNNTIDAYDYINVFVKDFKKNHVFKKEADVILNNRNLFRVSFTSNSGFIETTGNLYVSQDNFAIYRLEYTLYSSYKEKFKNRKRTNTPGSKEFLYEIIVGYNPIEGLMYPNYHSMQNTFIIKEPPKFKVNRAHYNLAKRYFVISLNNKANESDALKRSNYKLKFKGKKINIDKIVHIEDQVLLYPNPKVAKSMFEEISKVERNEIKGNTNFNIEIKNLRDINDNLIYEPSYKEVKQYREFFVQQIMTKPRAMPNDSLYMNKNLPLFKDQPISRPGNFSDYWMNTPLPNVEE